MYVIMGFIVRIKNALWKKLRLLAEVLSALSDG